MPKKILKGDSLRDKLKSGINTAVGAVAPTLGPVGMTSLIEYKGLDPIQCDDGVTILKNIELKDSYENMAVQLLRKAAIRTSNEGGDGTASTSVLTGALANYALSEIGNDSSKIRSVVSRLHKGLNDALLILSDLKQSVTTEQIEDIAKISSLDPEVAKLIAEVINDVGVNGIVTVEKNSRIGYEKEVVKGARFSSGLISPYFITNAEKEECVLENPAIAIIDRRVSTNEQITSVMNSIAENGVVDILFIADDVDSLALASLIINHQQGRFKVACVKNPYTASRAKEFLFDIAALTGGTVVSEEAGMRLENMDFSQCGKAQKVVVNKDTCTIIGGQASEVLQERISMIEEKIESSTSEYEKSMLKDRLASLTGGIGVIKVWAYTDTEFNAKKYKFDNAINATQAALQEGIVAGGGVALSYVATRCKDPMFKYALNAPFIQMAINAGMYKIKRGKIVVDIALLNDGVSGYDFRTKEYVNMFSAGIVDPYKVVRLALESAVGITSSLITTETAIVNDDE